MIKERQYDQNIALKSLLNMGSTCAFIAGISYVIIVFCAFLSPTTIASYVTSNQYFKDFEGYRNIFIFLKIMMVIANSALIGVVLTFYSLRRAKNHGVMTLFSALAIIGLGVGILQSLQDATIVPHLANQYERASADLKNVIIAFGVANPAIYVVSLGLPGVWFIVVSLLALSNPFLPKPLVFLGLLWGVGNIVTVIAHLFVIIWLIYLVAFGALLAAPIWSLWEGLFLRKEAKKLML
jgi:hypothetical protein